MKISMLMPVYNCPADLLEKAIVSVTEQTHQDYELVIKDGNLENPATNDPRIGSLISALGPKVIYDVSPDGRGESTSGFYPAMNWCLRNATGDVFSYLGGDDERGDPDVLDYVNKEFSTRTKPFLLYSAAKWINRDGSLNQYKRPSVLPVTLEALKKENMLLTPAVFWNRAVVDNFGAFDVNFQWSADYEYWMRVWPGTETKFSPRVLGTYRKWSVSQCVKFTAETSAQAESIKGRLA